MTAYEFSETGQNLDVVALIPLPRRHPVPPAVILRLDRGTHTPEHGSRGQAAG